MRTKPLTKREWSKLTKICKVVADKLGVGSLTLQYCYDDKNDNYAYCWTLKRGWRGIIYFCKEFFELPLHRQLTVIVHEHVHVLMHPMDQVIHEMLHKNCDCATRNRIEDAIDNAREIVVSHCESALLELIMPHIKKVL
jgi:hypothetical protein